MIASVRALSSTVISDKALPEVKTCLQRAPCRAVAVSVYTVGKFGSSSKWSYKYSFRGCITGSYYGLIMLLPKLCWRLLRQGAHEDASGENIHAPNGQFQGGGRCMARLKHHTAPWDPCCRQPDSRQLSWPHHSKIGAKCVSCLDIIGTSSDGVGNTYSTTTDIP